MKKKNLILGLTLIEVLIAVLIVSFLGGVLYTTFSQGLRIWQLAGRGHVEFDARVELEKINSEFRNAFRNTAFPFKGAGNTVDFWTMKSTSVFPEKQSHISHSSAAFVHYQFDVYKKQVLKSEQTIENAVNPSTVGTSEWKPVLKNVSAFSLDYFTCNEQTNLCQWGARWESNQLPLAVRVTVSVGVEPSVNQMSQIIPILSAGI